jgi:hypothetical protein
VPTARRRRHLRGVARFQGPRCDIGAYEYQLLVTLVNPSSGASAGGTAVTVTGVGFPGATQVTFGGRPVTTFTIVNDTTITTVTPAGNGTVDVRVTNPARTSDVSAADQYAYLSPVPALPKAGVGPMR